MMRRLWLLLLVAGIAACTPAPSGPAAEGSAFPPVNVRGEGGAEQPWALPPGRLRVVNVWAVWCPPCRKEMPDLQRLAGRLAGEGIVVTTLVVETDPFLVEEFVRRYRLTLPVAMIAPRSAENRLGVFDYPLTLLVDGEGRIRMRLHGALDWEHPQVIAMLRDLAAGETVSAAQREAVLAAARSSFVRKALEGRKSPS